MVLFNDQKLNEFSVKTPPTTTIMNKTVFAPSNEAEDYCQEKNN
jgi:hypothetical protein